MNQIKRSLVLVLGLFALTSAVAIASHINTSTQAQGLLPPGNVNVVNTPTVTVGNTPASPALVRDVDNLPRQPFQANVSARLDGQDVFALPITVVPAGKRLVVETVAAQVLLEQGNRAYVALATNNAFQYYFAPTFTGTFNNSEIGFFPQDVYVINQQTHLYVDPEKNVSIFIRSNSHINIGRVYVTISGYLVDA